jgi:hypothetical protein
MQVFASSEYGCDDTSYGIESISHMCERFQVGSMAVSNQLTYEKWRTWFKPFLISESGFGSSPERFHVATWSAGSDRHQRFQAMLTRGVDLGPQRVHLAAIPGWAPYGATHERTTHQLTSPCRDKQARTTCKSAGTTTARTPTTTTSTPHHVQREVKRYVAKPRLVGLPLRVARCDPGGGACRKAAARLGLRARDTAPRAHDSMCVCGAQRGNQSEVSRRESGSGGGGKGEGEDG